MKNLKLLTGTAVLAGLLLTTGCVTNEETDGVKALREAQAAKINAEATAATITAEAQAAYDNARAAVEQAKVAIEEAKAELQAAQAEAVRISNALASATNENEIAKLEFDLAQAELQANLSQTQIQSQIDLLMVQAQRDLEDAQTQLDLSLLQYAADLAEANAENKVLDKYLDLYVGKMNDISNQRTDIIEKNREILTAQMKMDTNNDGTPDELLTVVALDIAKKERELAILNDWKATYVAATNNPDDLAVDSVEAAGTVAELETLLANKELEIVEAEADVEDAQIALDKAIADGDAAAEAAAQEDYDDAVDALAELNYEESLLETEKTQAEKYLTAVAAGYSALVSNLDDLNEDIENKVGAIATLNNEVASWNDYIAALQAELAVLESELEILQAQADNYKVLIDEETAA